MPIAYIIILRHLWPLNTGIECLYIFKKLKSELEIEGMYAKLQT